MTLRMVANVISFNRLEMVKRCVESLRAQTHPLDAILVVDSSTKPEVPEWLNAQADVTTLYIDDLGSAGGKHYGLKWALARAFDWQWLMDDDVVLTPDALEQLVIGVPHIKFFTRGDEVEYGLRTMRAGHHIYSYLPSRATHPSCKTEFITLFGKNFHWAIC